MIASWFNLDGGEVKGMEYSPITPLILRAAIDAERLFNVKATIISRNYAVLESGNKRLVIGYERDSNGKVNN